MAEQIVVLRMGHRIPRDLRVTTHVCLTARALGANGLILADVVDTTLEKTILDVCQRFGGVFRIRMGEPWRHTVKEWKSTGGEIVHLTAYGMPLTETIEVIRASPCPKLVVVGASKVPGEVFEEATWNVAVTNQPISEVSALAIFLDWLFEHRRLQEEFANAKIRIIPAEHGKKVERANPEHQA